jgi:hypothetical protein
VCRVGGGRWLRVVQDCCIVSMDATMIVEMGDLQATERLGAGSVYFVRFGSGEAGRLGVSWTGRGVDSLAIVAVHHLTSEGMFEFHGAVPL